MSEFELVTANPLVSSASYVVACWKCNGMFDATSERWCACDAKLRTIQCPHCDACFCQAPFDYKRTFWNDAPKMLREHSRRFRIPTRNADVPSEVAVSSPRRQRVLIVDDEEPMRSLAACYVEEMGYEVTTVPGPEEALRLTDAGSFDVVLTDALMPKMDGRELCRRLKQAHGDAIKVVLMTSLYTANRFRTEAKHVFQVDEYLAKPLRYGELRDALQRVAPILR
jgi:CheY-like chemotaxis protein